MPEPTQITLYDANNRQFILYGVPGSWSAVYTTDERHDQQKPTMLDEYENAENALQNIQEPFDRS